MKFIVILIFSFFIFDSQLKAQIVDLDLRRKTLNEVLQILHTLTGYNFSIHKGVSQARGLINFRCSKMPLPDALRGMLDEDIYAVTINGHNVQIGFRRVRQNVVTRPVLDSTALHDLRGIVVDTGNNPLPNATILLKSRNQSFVAEDDGTFLIPKVAKQDTFTITYMGYEKKDFACNEDSFMRCMLFAQDQQLAPYISKGCYDVDPNANTGRISILWEGDITKQPVSDPLMALVGRSAGVVVNQESGITGSAINVSIEGINSLANGNAPLFIVDGVPLAMTVLNQLQNAAGNLSSMQLPQPENIERIEILKDADASAIYGCRGANGVVLIKTKRPTAGKTTLNVSVYSGQGKITRGLKLMNTQQYLAMRHEALRNDTTVAGITDYDLTKWDTTRYTDWQKKFLGGHSNVINATGSLSGGNEQTRFSIGGAYRRETALFSQDFASTTLSADMAVMHVSHDKKTTVDIGLHYMNNDNQIPINDITPKILLAPNAPSLFTPSGELNWEDTTFQNPYGELQQRYQAVFNHFLGSCKLSYELLPKLKLSANLGYNYIQLNERLVIPLSSMTPALSNISALRANSEGLNAIQSWIIEPQANYSLRLGDAHAFDVLAGVTLQQSKQHQALMVGTDFESDALVENISMAVNKDFTTNENLYRYEGIYTRLGYSFNNLLYLNFTGRRDGSSRFSVTRRSENFGSAGIAWLFSRMPMIQKLPFLTFGKVYANIGRTGNDQFSDYQFYDIYSVSTGYGGVLGLERTQLTNYLYKWEILIKSSVGFELCFSNRYSIAVNYYRNRTRNQLVRHELPAITGYKYTTENLPAVVENHGLEVEFDIKQIQHRDFQWRHSFNFTIPDNKLISYPDIASSQYASVYEVGLPLEVRFVYQFKGVSPDSGIALFKDLNNDGKVDKLDKAAKFIGPKFYAGWEHKFTYKGLSLSIALQFVKQTGYYAASMYPPGYFVPTGGNQPLSDAAVWKKSGDLASEQKYTADNKSAEQATNLLTQSDASIVDASFIRLRNVSISWDLPQSWSTRVKLKAASLFLNSQNLATWTHFKGMDPEMQNFHVSYRQPPQRIIVAGLRISL